MKKIALLIAAFFAIFSAKAYVVVDDGDGTPVIGATVIGKSGMILGQTGSNGEIAIGSSRELPLTIRYLGYEQMEYAGPGDTIRLVPVDYQLSEVVVSPAERPIMRVVCFGREYCTGITAGDTMQLYCEYMAEAFVVDGKVKGYKKSDRKLKVKNAKMYARMAKKDGRDTIFKPKKDGSVAMLAWSPSLAELPTETINMPQSMLDGAEADTVMGKYAPKIIYRKKNNTFTCTRNNLCDHKSGVWSPPLFKLLGMTADFSNITINESYALNDRGVYGIYDMVSEAYNLHLLGRGKLIKFAMGTKEPIDMDSYFEIYPVGITHLTVEEYKEMREDKTSVIPFNPPADLPPLSTAIQNLIEAIDN